MINNRLYILQDYINGKTLSRQRMFISQNQLAITKTELDLIGFNKKLRSRFLGSPALTISGKDTAYWWVCVSSSLKNKKLKELVEKQIFTMELEAFSS